MYHKPFIKKLLILFLIFFFIPFYVQGKEEKKFFSYQVLKNVTANDLPEGDVYTLGDAGDEVRHLFSIYNQDDFERDFDINIQLPKYLEYIQGSTDKYNGQWTDFEDITTTKSIHLMPQKSVYIRYSTKISEHFPNENRILVILAEVSNDQLGKVSSVNKIYVPNFEATKPLNIENKGVELTKEEEVYIKKKYEEEKTIMEESYLEFIKQKNDNNETYEKLDKNSEDSYDTKHSFFLNIFIISFTVAFFTLVFKLLYNEKNNN